jgi:Mrp family chromosome partitioning ATPase
VSKNFELMQGARLHVDPDGSAGLLPANPVVRPQGASQPAEIPKVPSSFAARWLRKESSRPATRQSSLAERGNPLYLTCLDDEARAESTKLVRTVFPLTLDDSHRLVVFAGVDSSSSCAWVCAHAADTLANRKGKKVCLVDANFSTPLLPQLFGVTNRYGLTDALDNPTPICDFSTSIRPDSLWLLCSGQLAIQSHDALTSEAMHLRLSELRKEFDYVLLHCSPLPKHDDAMALAQWADGLVLVLDVSSPCRELAATATQRVRAAGIKLLGAVLNKRSFPQPGTLYRDY